MKNKLFLLILFLYISFFFFFSIKWYQSFLAWFSELVFRCFERERLEFFVVISFDRSDFLGSSSAQGSCTTASVINLHISITKDLACEAHVPPERKQPTFMCERVWVRGALSGHWLPSPTSILWSDQSPMVNLLIGDGLRDILKFLLLFINRIKYRILIL